MIKKKILFIFLIFFFFNFNKTLVAENNSKIKKPQIVLVGVYVNSINYVDLKKGLAEIDFYIWLRTNKNPKIFKSIEITNSSDLVKSFENKDFFNGEHYYSARYKLTAYQNFNFEKFPLNNQEIYFNIESADFDINSLVFKVDNKNSNIAEKITKNGYKIQNLKIEVDEKKYLSNFGDTRINNNSSIYSNIKFTLPMIVEGYGYFLKLLSAIFLSAFISYLSLYIKPTNLDARFGLPIGSFFAVVATNYILTSMLPEMGIITMGEIIILITIIFIFFVLIISTITLHYMEKNQEILSIKINKVSKIYFPILYFLAISITIFF